MNKLQQILLPIKLEASEERLTSLAELAGEGAVAAGGRVVTAAGERTWVSRQRIGEGAGVDVAGGRTSAGRRAGVEGGKKGALKRVGLRALPSADAPRPQTRTEAIAV